MATEPTRFARLRSIFSGSAGNLVEYFDWYVYSSFALYFAKVFFPKGDTTAQLLSAAAVFAVGFLMRPLGGWLMGVYADAHGRKSALLASVLAMGAGSAVIAVTPGYASIGVWAPVLLVAARLLQGLSLGGEYASSATYLSELAPKASRGFYSSFLYATLSMGQVLALLVLVVLQQLLTPAALESWGWRVPFAIGALLSLSVVLLRLRMTETQAFLDRPQDNKPPLAELAKHWRACLTVVALTMGGTVSFYAFTTYMQKFLVNTSGLSKTSATGVMAIALVLFMALQPLFGALSDRIGRRPLLIAFGFLGATATVPLFTRLAVVQTPGAALALVLAGLAITSLYTSVNAIVKAELFPVHIRALGVGLPYALTVSLFGGTAEYVALALKDAGHESAFYYYVAACAAVSLLVFSILPDSKAISRLDND